MQLLLFGAQAMEPARGEGSVVARVCRTCRQEKPIPDFETRNGKATTWCRRCKENYRKARGYGAAYRAKHRERVRQYAREWRAAHPEKNKEWDLRSLYGLSLDEYRSLLDRQQGVCAICARPETTQIEGKVLKLAVDHDHSSGRVRGLLCRRCNTVLGHLGERIDIARALIAYLEEHAGATIDGQPHVDGCRLVPLQGDGSRRQPRLVE